MKALFITVLLAAALFFPACVTNNITLTTGPSGFPAFKVGQNVPERTPAKVATPAASTAPKAIPVLNVTSQAAMPEKAPSKIKAEDLESPTKNKHGAPILDPKKVLVDIDLSKQTGQVFYEKVSWYTFKFSSGKIGYSTPTGTYFIDDKKEVHHSTEHHCDMPKALRLNILDVNGKNRGIFIHEGRIQDANPYPASHRCIRVNPTDATKLYGIIPIGSMVKIHGSEMDFYRKSFDGWDLLVFDDSGKPYIKRNPDKSLTDAFMAYVMNKRKIEVYNKDINGKKVDKSQGVLGFEFMEEPWKQGVPVQEYMRTKERWLFGQ